MKNTDPNIAKPPTARKAPRSTLVKKITTVSGTATTVLGTIMGRPVDIKDRICPTDEKLESPPPSPPVFKETLIFRVPVSGCENEEDNLRNMLAEVAAVDASDVRTEFGTGNSSLYRCAESQHCGCQCRPLERQRAGLKRLLRHRTVNPSCNAVSSSVQFLKT